VLSCTGERSRPGCGLWDDRYTVLRRRCHLHTEAVETAPHGGGWVAPGFEEVRDEFDRNFAERGEIGALRLPCVALVGQHRAPVEELVTGDLATRVALLEQLQR
jgi:hypothetical protein